MSFQDFGRKSSSRPTPSLSTSVPTPATATHSSSQSNPLANISDTLLQYQVRECFFTLLFFASFVFILPSHSCNSLDWLFVRYHFHTMFNAAAAAAVTTRSFVPFATTLDNTHTNPRPFQRNVGILEKISHSLVTSTKNCPELDAQYRAQMDVLGQLEDKIRRLIDEQLIHSSPQHQSTVTKLQRDFDRVQNRVRAMQSAVEKWKKQQHVKAASIAPTTTANTLTVEEQQYQLQLQLQQDVRY